MITIFTPKLRAQFHMVYLRKLDLEAHALIAELNKGNCFAWFPQQQSSIDNLQEMIRRHERWHERLEAFIRRCEA